MDEKIINAVNITKFEVSFSEASTGDHCLMRMYFEIDGTIGPISFKMSPTDPNNHHICPEIDLDPFRRFEKPEEILMEIKNNRFLQLINFNPTTLMQIADLFAGLEGKPENVAKYQSSMRAMVGTGKIANWFTFIIFRKVEKDYHHQLKVEVERANKCSDEAKEVYNKERENY